MIVPADETDSLACPESLSLPEPAAAGGSWEDEEIVHVFTTPVPQRQLFRFSVRVYFNHSLSRGSDNLHIYAGESLVP